MNAQIDIVQQLINWTINHSGAETRAYLGMSRIGECPRVLYHDLVSGGMRDWSIEAHLNCYAGYMFERDVIERLIALNLYRPGSSQELIADFDNRFRGHTDGSLNDGRLLEIKSTVQANLDQIMVSKRIARRHFEQVQTYLYHGKFPAALMIYIARDTGKLWSIEIELKQNVSDRLNKKAQQVLKAFDLKITPPCECGKCR